MHYKPEAGELLIDCELPRHDVIPAVASYRYIMTKKELRPTARTEADRKRRYGQLIARIVLRVIREALDATPPAIVDTVTTNAHVSAVHTATGRPIRPCLVSVMAERDEFDQLHLDAPELDPQRCLRYLNAIVSPHPYDLEAVRPVAEFDLSKYKFVEEMQVAAGLDGRPDLLDLTPVEFEHLVRELFEATGMQSWVTQTSRDEGVDAVATNPDPVLGGLCVIQAKRYKGIVGLEAVHALGGVMHDKAAAKGHPRHHVLVCQGQPHLRSPQRSHPAHRRPQPQIPHARQTRTRRPDRPAPTPPRMGTRRRHLVIPEGVAHPHDPSWS